MAPPRPLHANWFRSAALPELRLAGRVAVPPFDWPAAPAFARTSSTEGRGQPRRAARDWSAELRGRARAARSASPGARGAATAASVASVASGSVASGSTAAGIACPHPPAPPRPPSRGPARGHALCRGTGEWSRAGPGIGCGESGSQSGDRPGSGVGGRGPGRGRAGVGTRDRGRESGVGSRGRGPGRGSGVKLGPGPGSLWSWESAARGRVRGQCRAWGAGLARLSPAESPEDPRPARTNLDGGRVVCRAGRGGAGGGVREVPAGLWGAPSSS